MQQTFRVVKEHQGISLSPLSGQKGERLGWERRESEWPGWLWCTHSSGRCGWVPESWLELADETAVLLRDYSATELSVAPGQVLFASLFESGWAWATNEDGEEGWVPLDNLERMPQAQTAYLLSDLDQVKLLRKLMLYWDGQWFLKAVEQFGLHAAIDLNARVRASFGRIEMRLLLKTVGKSQADNLPDALHLLETYAGAFMGSTLRADFVVLGPQEAEVQVSRCAAYEGAKRAALSRADQACMACENLWSAWLEILLPEDPIQIDILQRQGMGDSICQFRFRAGLLPIRA
jgi:hypothetical protein